MQVADLLSCWVFWGIEAELVALCYLLRTFHEQQKKSGGV